MKEEGLMEESQSGRLLRQLREICEVAGIRAEEYAKTDKMKGIYSSKIDRLISASSR